MADAATGPVNVITVAHFTGGLGEAILDTYRRVVPLVHQEPGCELFAVNIDEGQNAIVIIERRSTPEEQQAHKDGPLTRRLKDLHTGLHAGRNKFYYVEPTNIGDPHKGAIRPA